MARGQNIVIPSNSSALVDTLSREEMASAAILNPNDGVVFVRLNGDVSTTAPSGWDWKLPSQSYGLFPGPWQSLGLYFLDQSGAGHQGEITIYDSNLKLPIPDIRSIGRALQAQTTALDITQGSQPANPPTSVDRLWAQADVLHLLSSTGADRSLISTATPLGGALAGFLPSPTLSNTGIITSSTPMGGALSGFLPNAAANLYYQRVSLPANVGLAAGANTALLVINNIPPGVYILKGQVEADSGIVNNYIAANIILSPGQSFSGGGNNGGIASGTFQSICEVVFRVPTVFNAGLYCYSSNAGTAHWATPNLNFEATRLEVINIGP